MELHVILDRRHDRIVYQFAGSLDDDTDHDIDGLLEAFDALDFGEIVLDCAGLAQCGGDAHPVIAGLCERILRAHRVPRIVGLDRPAVESGLAETLR